MNVKEIMAELKKPFEENEVEWKVQSCGISTNGKPWARVLTYIDARAIQERLDDLFGVNGWKDKYRENGEDIICTLSIMMDGKWVSKENGASKTKYESFKGGISSAFKRVSASGFGVGRYLYDLEATFVEDVTLERPAYKDKKDWIESYDKESKKNIYWKAPKLPSWALPQEKKPGKLLEDKNKVVFINRKEVVALKALVGKHTELEKHILESHGYTSASQIHPFVYEEILEQIKTGIRVEQEKLEKARIEKKHKEELKENKTIFGDKRIVDIIGVDTPIKINCKYKGKTLAEVYEIDPEYIKNYAETGYVQHLKAICIKIVEKINNENKKTS